MQQTCRKRAANAANHLHRNLGDVSLFRLSRPAVPVTEGDSRSVLLDKCRAVSTLEKSIGTEDEAGDGSIR
ncbi:hypothetical protein [Methanosphaerula palustris]|nr:hypothetical protein [Methanosphaerula palustris]